MTIDNLRDDLDALPGVEAAEVVLRDAETPVARVWLDGTRDSDEVRKLVDALVGRSIPSVVLPRRRISSKRIGLGRGLGDLIPSDEQNSPPVHLQPTAGQKPAVVRVSVGESTRGVTVEIEDGTGTVHREPVGDDGDLDGAVIRGVVSVVSGSHGVHVNAIDMETDDGLVVMVTAKSDDKRAVGASFIEYGRPYALALAAFAALSDL
jgi:hypothetical protein